MRVLAVIPAYNEEDCLAATVHNLTSTCPDIDYLVVNDGSRDRTGSICDELGLNHVDLPINTGLSSGFRTGVTYAWNHGYDAVVQFDADGQHLPEYLHHMTQAMLNHNADIVIGSRYLNGQKADGMRNVGSHIISGLIRLTTGTVVTDPTCGLRMYSRRIMPAFITDFDTGPEPDTIALLIRDSARITEIPIAIQERQGGESYLKPTNAVRYMLRMCASIVLFQWFR